jgi:hypothetical protein
MPFEFFSTALLSYHLVLKLNFTQTKLKSLSRRVNSIKKT